MRRVLGISTFLALLLLAVAPANAITFGSVDRNLHPNVGSLLLVNEDGSYFQECTGTLISPTVFLTAAHCVYGEDPNSFLVTFAPVIKKGITVYSGIAYYDQRYGTTGESHPYDIAVIVFDEPVTGIQPAELPTEGLLDQLYASHDLRDQVFTAVGYGTIRNDFTGGYSTIEDNAKRRYVEQYLLNLEDQWALFSMNPNTGSGGTCYGDSGGPHFLGGTDSNLVVAITITGDAVCKATDKDYRLDTPEAREFLAQFVDLP
jgi:V8-like Glu-specific endopeptidase